MGALSIDWWGARQKCTFMGPTPDLETPELWMGHSSLQPNKPFRGPGAVLSLCSILVTVLRSSRLRDQ